MRAGQTGSDPDSDPIADRYALAISDLYSHTKFDTYTLGYADGVSHPDGYTIGGTHYQSDSDPLSISHPDPHGGPAGHTRISGAFVRGL